MKMIGFLKEADVDFKQFKRLMFNPNVIVSYNNGNVDFVSSDGSVAVIFTYRYPGGIVDSFNPFVINIKDIKEDVFFKFLSEGLRTIPLVDNCYAKGYLEKYRELIRTDNESSGNMVVVIPKVLDILSKMKLEDNFVVKFYDEMHTFQIHFDGYDYECYIIGCFGSLNNA